MDQHTNLLRKMTLVGGSESGYNGLESSVDYDTEAIGDGNGKFYEWNGAASMAFPTM